MENDDSVESVELSEVNDILLDAVAYERIENFKQIIRLNIKLVQRLYALKTKVRYGMYIVKTTSEKNYIKTGKK